MKQVITGVVLALLGLASGALCAEEEAIRLDLPAAIERAIRHNLRLARAGLGTEQARLGVDDAEEAFSIRLTPKGSGSLGNDSDQWQAGLEVSRKFSSGAQATLGASARETAPRGEEEAAWRTGVRVDIRQPLFSQYGSLVQREQVRLAQEQLDRERRSWEQQKADLAMELVETFEDLINLQQQIGSDEAFFERTDKLYRLTRAREEQGRSTRVDTLRVELQRGQAQARLENNRERLFTRSRDLAELTGYPQDAQFELVPPPLPELELPSAEDALSRAMENRLDYAQALADLRARERDIKLSRKKLLPDVALVAAAEQYGEESSFQDAADMRENTWMIGLAGDTDLLKTRERTALRRSELDAQSASEAVEIKRITITREILQALSRCRRARSEVQIQERNYQLAESRVLLAQRLYESGRSDNFSVTDAEDALLKAEISRLASRSDWVIATYNLFRQMGTLVETPEELKPE